MFRVLTRLLFGGEDETRVDVTSGDVAEEEWFIISHQEAVPVENQSVSDRVLLDPQPSNSALHGDPVANIEADTGVLEVDSADLMGNNTGRVVAGSIPSAKALLGVTQSTCIQSAWIWADRHHMTRSATQRRNRIRQRVQQKFFHLQQPGHRKLSH